MNNKLLVGTSKGLIIFKKERSDWKIVEIQFRGLPISTVYVDERTNTWWVGLAHRHWGQKLNRSRDEGVTWTEIAPPKYPDSAKLSSNKPATLKKIWVLQHAGLNKPNGIWLGTEPGGLFYSENNGEDFELVETLWNHPSRNDENQWFGAGRDEPFIHSIIINPRDNDHVYIGVSCAGVFETKDDGKQWSPKNKGLIATYLPNSKVEVGHDPHSIKICKSMPNIIWQQNHCGVFRTEDGGDNWKNVSDQSGIANYGFALVIDDENPEIAWTIPAVSDYERVAPNLSLCVCKTEDGGKTWTPQRNGLPQENTFDIVFRHAFDKFNNLMAFGSTNGNLYLSEDYGKTWKTISNNLARVETVIFA